MTASNEVPDDPLNRLVGDAHLVRQVFDELPFTIVVLHGPDHAIAAANAAYRQLAGWPDLVGRPIREVFPEVVGQRIFDMFDSVHASGRPDRMSAWRMQFETPDGTVELFADIDVLPRRDGTGAVAGVTCYITDVTAAVRERERERAEARESERRYLAAREVVAELQEALLPAEVPVLPAVRIDARYLVAAQDQAAGGDWFDAVPLTGGRVALVVGDTVGHGVAASAAMGQLRAVINELLGETGDLEQVLARADRLAARTAALRAATVCIAVLDPASGHVAYSTCGHPAPLIVTPDGSTRYLPPSGAGPLGTRTPLTVRSQTLRSGEILVLFSDGLVERAGRPLDEGLAGLAAVAADAATDRIFLTGAPARATERVCQHCVELLTRTGHADDVTILAAQRLAETVPGLRVDLDAATASVSTARADVAGWLDGFDPSPRDRSSIDLAVSELVANVIEHAYPQGAGTARLDAQLSADGVLELSVTDRGAWRDPGPTPAVTSGRGLWMVGTVVDDLELRPGRPGDPDAGTRVTIRRRLHRSVQIASGPAEPPPDTQSAFSSTVVDGQPRVLEIAGPVDVASAAELADRLSVAARGGVHPLVVDLTRASVLASAGVTVLFAARDQHTGHGTTLSVVARPGTVAAQVIDLVGLNLEPQTAGG